MANVGYATLSVIPSAKGFATALSRQTSPAMAAAGARGGDTMGKATKRSFLGPLKGIGGAILGAMAIQKVAQGIGSVISASSDLGESVNAVNVTFGDAADGILKLGEDAAKSVGLSNTEFNALAVQFSNFASTVAGPGGDVADTMRDLTGRAADFASVMNLEVGEAATLFQSGLAGETEPLRRYGIDLSAAAVEAFALSEGIVESKDQLTESAKVQARYALLMRETAKTQGDFANTSDSLANRQRILGAQWDNFKAKLGQGLIPVAERFTGLLSTAVERVGPLAASFAQTLAPAMERLRAGFETVRQVAASVVAAIGGFLGRFRTQLTTTGTTASGWAQTIAQIFNSIRGIVSGAMNAVKAIIGTAVKIVTGFWERFGSHLVDFATRFLTRILDVIRSAFEVVRNIFKAVTSLLRGDWQGFWNAIKSIASNLLNIVKNVIAQAFDTIKTIFGAAVAAISQVWSFLWNAIRTGVTAGVRNTVSWFRELPGKILAAIQSLPGKMLNFARSALGAAGGFLAGIFELWVDINRWFQELPGKILSAIGDLGGVLLDAGKDLIQGLLDGITGSFGRVRDTLTGFTSKLTSWKGPPATDRRLLEPAGQMIMDGLDRGLRSRFATIRSTLGDATALVSNIDTGAAVAGGRRGPAPSFGGEVHMHVQAWTDRFSLSQVEEEFAARGAV